MNGITRSKIEVENKNKEVTSFFVPLSSEVIEYIVSPKKGLTIDLYLIDLYYKFFKKYFNKNTLIMSNRTKEKENLYLIHVLSVEGYICSPYYADCTAHRVISRSL